MWFELNWRQHCEGEPPKFRFGFFAQLESKNVWKLGKISLAAWHKFVGIRNFVCLEPRLTCDHGHVEKTTFGIYASKHWRRSAWIFQVYLGQLPDRCSGVGVWFPRQRDFESCHSEGPAPAQNRDPQIRLPVDRQCLQGSQWFTEVRDHCSETKEPCRHLMQKKGPESWPFWWRDDQWEDFWSVSHRLLPNELGVSFCPDHHCISLFFRHINCMKQEKPFRSSFTYNNIMYALAGKVVEVLMGRPYEESVRAEILSPLGMTSSSFRHEPAVPGTRRASQYGFTHSGSPLLEITRDKYA